MSTMEILHSPSLWMAVILLGVFGLLADAAWRSWTLEGRVADPSELFPRRASPRLAYAFGPQRPPLPAGPTAGVRLFAEPVEVRWPGPQTVHEAVGATLDWSPIAEVAGAGRSLEDWLSERLQQYDETLKRIDQAKRGDDGEPHWRGGETWSSTSEALEQFVQGSMRLPAYRELRIGSTGEFSRREAMELEAQLVAA